MSLGPWIGICVGLFHYVHAHYRNSSRSLNKMGPPFTRPHKHLVKKSHETIPDKTPYTGCKSTTRVPDSRVRLTFHQNLLLKKK